MLILPPLPPGSLVWRSTELPPPAPLLLLDPVNPETGDVLEELELFAFRLKRAYPETRLGLHLTYWIGGLAYGEAWGVDFLLLHAEVFQRLHGFLPDGPWAAAIGGWSPPAPWRLLAQSYAPEATHLSYVNRYLAQLSGFRRRLPDLRPEASTLFRTTTSKGSYYHFSLSELQAHVAALRG